MQKIITPINEKYMDDNNILHIRVLEGAEITLENLMTDHQMGLALTKGKKTLALVDTRASFIVTPEARKYMKEEITDKHRIATAVVTDNGFSRIIVNFFMMFNNPATPFKMFDCPEKAEKWLLQIKSEKA